MKLLIIYKTPPKGVPKIREILQGFSTGDTLNAE